MLVGLTELKAQIGWIDSVTVSSQGNSILLTSLIFVICGLGGREKVRNIVSTVARC